MVEMLELSGWELNTTTINMLRVLTGNTDSMPEQTGNANREIEILRQEEMLKIKNTVTETKNVFDGLISRQGMSEERISELEAGNQ